jgi:hypothetical protein
MTAEFFRGQAVEPVVGNVDPGVDMKTPPKIQVDMMPAAKFFAYAAEILKLQPPHITDEPILAQMRRIGISTSSIRRSRPRWRPRPRRPSP